MAIYKDKSIMKTFCRVETAIAKKEDSICISDQDLGILTYFSESRFVQKPINVI